MVKLWWTMSRFLGSLPGFSIFPNFIPPTLSTFQSLPSTLYNFIFSFISCHPSPHSRSEKNTLVWRTTGVGTVELLSHMLVKGEAGVRTCAPLMDSEHKRNIVNNRMGTEWLTTILQPRAHRNTGKISLIVVAVAAVPRWMDLLTWAYTAE